MLDLRRNLSRFSIDRTNRTSIHYHSVDYTMIKKIKNILAGLLIITVLIAGIIGAGYQAVSPHAIPPEGYYPYIIPMVQHDLSCPIPNPYQENGGRRRNGLTCRPILSNILV